MTRVAIVAGICVPGDAISAAVATQAALLNELPGIESVDVFVQFCSRPVDCMVHNVGSSWELLCHPRFQAADVAIMHWGVHFDLFDSLAILPQLSAAGDGPVPVVHFHNSTPRDLVDPSSHDVIERSVRQIQLLASSAVAVWTYSPFNVETLLALDVAAARIGFVPFPVDAPRPIRPHRRKKHLDLVAVGRIVPAKGQHVLVEALSMLPAKLLRRITLRIAGNASLSSDQYLAGLIDQVAARGLSNHVQFIGQPDDEALWSLYERSHILVSTSSHEGFCVPVLEAYIAGCKVIGTHAGNLPYIVQPPDPVVPPNDPAALALAIEVVANELQSASTHDRPLVAALIERYSTASARTHLAAGIDELLASRALL